MSAINIKKVFRPQSTYHIYNRGAFKKPVFRDKNDFEYFYILLAQERKAHNVRINVECLMINHYHMQVYQRKARAIQHFMKSVGIRYAMYFCKKYNHSGQVFQGRYKAALLRGAKRIRENVLYILNNPIEAGYDYWPYVGRFWRSREK